MFDVARTPFCSIRRILIHPESQWVKLLLLNTPEITNIFTLGTVYLNSIAKQIKNPFWMKIIQSYISFIGNIRPKNQSDLLTTPIWFNELISNGTLYIPSLSKRGYNFICDFIEDTGQPLSQPALSNQTNTPINWLDHYNYRC